MNELVAIDSLADRLRSVAKGNVAPAVRDHAQRLIDRLDSPVRVVLLGFPGSAKLELMNALAGGQALPEAARGTTVELRYGPQDLVRVTRHDGAVAERPGPLEPEEFGGFALVELERPMPLLRRISLLNVVADAAPAEQRAAIGWARRRTDIALWCSLRYAQSDHAVWSAVPDALKDHGYLVLTACDPDGAAEIKALHRDDFVDVYTVDLVPGTGPAGDDGVGELADRILYHADLGRRADADSALMFLRSHETRAHVGRTQVSRRVNVSRIPLPESLPPANSAQHALLAAGFAFLRDRGEALLARVRSEDALEDAEIVEACDDTLDRLSDILSSHDEATAAPVSDLIDSVLEAVSLVVLLGTERDAEPAVDAVTLLLQLRHDFEARLAA